MDHRLPGLEQYSLERAGYFIRRSAIGEDIIAAARRSCERVVESDYLDDHLGMESAEICGDIGYESVVQSIANDILGDTKLRNTRICLADGSPPVAWSRAYPLDATLPVAAQAAQLHATPPAFEIMVPLDDHSSLIV